MVYRMDIINSPVHFVDITWLGDRTDVAFMRGRLNYCNFSQGATFITIWQWRRSNYNS